MEYFQISYYIVLVSHCNQHKPGVWTSSSCTAMQCLQAGDTAPPLCTAQKEKGKKRMVSQSVSNKRQSKTQGCIGCFPLYSHPVFLLSFPGTGDHCVFPTFRKLEDQRQDLLLCPERTNCSRRGKDYRTI